MNGWREQLETVVTTAPSTDRYNVVGDLYCVQMGLAVKISTRFFKAGHSFMKPDQVSGRINHALRKHDIIELPDDAFLIMANARRSLI